MIGIYCHDTHGVKKGALCGECQELLEYARLRLRHCPFQERKTTCGNCQRHCYKPAMREKIRNIMRYSGPRMIWHHPLMAIRHMIDGLRKGAAG